MVLHSGPLLIYGLPVAVVSLLFLWPVWCSNISRLPPGPRKLPLIGNILSIPATFPWKLYAHWAKVYKSDVIHLQLFRNSVVILNSFQAANDLLGKRSSIYSHRPPSVMINKLMGLSWMMVSLSYGKHWKDQRVLFHHYLHPSDDSLHKPRELQYIHQLMLDILVAPERFRDLIKHSIGGLMYSLAYGISTHPTNDPYIQFSDQVATVMGEVMVPASALVDSVPILNYIPETLPGGSFKRKARQWRELTDGFREVPFDAVRARLADGTAMPSFASRCLESLDGPGDNDYNDYELDLVKNTAGIFFIAGTSSTSAVIYTFILAMMCFPEVQAKAQNELDRVVGKNRLPDFNDERHLPYLSAVLKESARWRPVGPIGVAHYLKQEDTYNGYVIPANSIIIANAWAMLHDENEYPDPFSFNPERFLKDGQLDPEVRDPASITFGFGRRACPGMHISTSTIWLAAACMLSAFTISKSIDENGRVIEPSMQYTSGVTCQPLPFRCDIEPRYEQVEDVIRSSMEVVATA